MKISNVIPSVVNDLSLADAAIEYGRAGFRVFPLHDAGSKKGKQPRIRNWQNVASADENQIRRWWEKSPKANIGLLTGSEVGFYALDIDPRNEGDKSLTKLIEQHGRFPETVKQYTGGGGCHFLFKCPNPQKNRTRVLAGIDIKACKGFIVASPSIHPDTKQPYEWESFPRKEDIAEPPYWLSDLLSESKPERYNKQSEVEKRKKTSFIAIGTRNNSLFEIGCSLKSSGISNNEISSTLKNLNLSVCEEPLPEEELKGLINRVLSYKRKAPYLRYRDWILSQDCPCDSLCKFILTTITTYMNSGKTNCYPSQKQISEKTGISRKTINKKLRKAMDEGWIEVSKNKNSDQKYSNNIYFIPKRFR